MNNGTSARTPLLRTWFLFLICWSTLLSLEGASSGQSSQDHQQPHDKGASFYRIDVEDSIEAGLIEQQLKVKPTLIRSRSFYYYGNEEINQLLRRNGYEPVRVNRVDVLTRLVMVIRKQGTEEDLAEAGVTVVLREREYWVVRATLRQLQLVERLGFSIEELGHREPRPRQVRIAVSRLEQVAEVGSLRVDIYDTTKSKKGYVIMGGAFDDRIDELKAAGFEVEIMPDPPGVIR
jgi:hypothetical protein